MVGWHPPYAFSLTVAGAVAAPRVSLSNSRLAPNIRLAIQEPKPNAHRTGASGFASRNNETDRFVGDEWQEYGMGKNGPPPPSYHFSKVLDTSLRCGKISAKFCKVFFAGIFKKLKGPEPKFLARLSTRMDLFAHYDSNDELEKLCIRKNGQFPSCINNHDSLKSITVSKPTDKVRRLLFLQSSDATILHDGALWGWTPDGVYLRVLIGDVSMLLTFQEVASLRGILFPTDKINEEDIKI
jgi:hypothetical protein